MYLAILRSSPLITSAHHRASLPTTVSCCPSFQGQRGAAAAMRGSSKPIVLWQFGRTAGVFGLSTFLPGVWATLSVSISLPNRFGNLFLAFLPSPLHGHRPRTPRCLDQADRDPLTTASAPHNLRENQREPLTHPQKAYVVWLQRACFTSDVCPPNSPFSPILLVCLGVLACLA